MPFLSPSAARVPPLSFLLADQVEPPRHIARHLGLSLPTLQRYAASGNAPRAVYLALWFESSWGATLHAQAINEAQHARCCQVWLLPTIATIKRCLSRPIQRLARSGGEGRAACSCEERVDAADAPLARSLKPTIERVRRSWPVFTQHHQNAWSR